MFMSSIAGHQGCPSSATIRPLSPIASAKNGAIDLYRAAKLYVDQHGDQAALQAAGNLG